MHLPRGLLRGRYLGSAGHEEEQGGEVFVRAVGTHGCLRFPLPRHHLPFLLQCSGQRSSWHCRHDRHPEGKRGSEEASKTLSRGAKNPRMPVFFRAEMGVCLHLRFPGACFVGSEGNADCYGLRKRNPVNPRFGCWIPALGSQLSGMGQRGLRSAEERSTVA